ncbi:MAG: TraR/DksA C4-type zinc finger protein [Bacillota bacterium]
MNAWDARARLLEERRKLETLAHHLEEGIARGTRESLQELSTVDNHPADLGSETFERGKDIGLLDSAKRLLAKIDSAIQRINSGRYGLCAKCGRRIPEERVEAVPWVELCAECQRTEEAAGGDSARPVEEEVVPMPVGKKAPKGSPGFDGSDVWEELAQHSTSNSTQDEASSIGNHTPSRSQEGV